MFENTLFGSERKENSMLATLFTFNTGEKTSSRFPFLRVLSHFHSDMVANTAGIDRAMESLKFCRVNSPLLEQRMPWSVYVTPSANAYWIRQKRNRKRRELRVQRRNEAKRLHSRQRLQLYLLLRRSHLILIHKDHAFPQWQRNGATIRQTSSIVPVDRSLGQLVAIHAYRHPDVSLLLLHVHGRPRFLLR